MTEGHMAERHMTEENMAQIAAIGRELLEVMEAHEADFTHTFRSLVDHLPTDPEDTAQPADIEPNTFAPSVSSDDLFAQPKGRAWRDKWHALLKSTTPIPKTKRIAAMNAANPAVIPRNHRIEEAIQAAHDGDFSYFERLHTVLSTPFALASAHATYANPPEPQERVRRTFCGT